MDRFLSDIEVCKFWFQVFEYEENPFVKLLSNPDVHRRSRCVNAGGRLQVSYMQPCPPLPEGLHSTSQRSQRGQTVAGSLRPDRPGQGVPLLPLWQDALLLLLPWPAHARPLGWASVLVHLLRPNFHNKWQHAQTPADTWDEDARRRRRHKYGCKSAWLPEVEKTHIDSGRPRGNLLLCVEQQPEW